MKKIFGVLLSLVLILSIGKVSALEYTYSEWSDLYPSGMDEMFIESEVRYKWYKFENNLVVYTDDYYTEYGDYIRDDGSAKTYYRYITNNKILLNAKNELITDENYCKKNFCYSKVLVEPTMVDLSEKVENNYENVEIYEYTPEVAPMTGDTIIYSFILLSIGLVVIAYFAIKKYKKMSIE